VAEHLDFLGYTTAELAAALELLNVEGAPKTLIESFEHGRATLTESRRAVLAGVAKAVTRVIGRGPTRCARP